jgi:GDP-L-fucose synthase
VNWITGQGVDSLPHRPDVFIHSAAIYGGLVFNQKYPEQILSANTMMNHNVMNYILKAKPKKVITIGSACAYPGGAKGELTENMLGTGRMERTVELYAQSKMWMLAACERLLDDWTQLVLANLYGPYDHDDMDKAHVVSALIYKFIAAQARQQPVQLLGTGIALRSLLYVKDAADVIAYFIDNPSTNAAVNVGHGQGVSILELANTIAEVLDFNQEILWGNQSDNGALVKILNYAKLDGIYPARRKTDLKSGLKSTINAIL